MKQNSQVNDVIKHLKMYGSITSLEAVEYYGILRLSGIIYRLRNEFDMEIITENISKKNRYGNISNYACYHLVQK